MLTCSRASNGQRRKDVLHHCDRGFDGELIKLMKQMKVSQWPAYRGNGCLKLGYVPGVVS